MEQYTRIGRIRPVFKGEWNDSEKYYVLDIVRRNDGYAAYIAIKDVPVGTKLSNTDFWQVLVDVSAMSGGSGTSGVDGGYYTPDVSEDGMLAWVASKEDMPAVPSVNIKGSAGYTPVKGKDYFDGLPGKDGNDGVSPSVSISKSGKVTTIAITDKGGTKTATINDGADGSPGEAGFSPEVSVATITGGHRVTITDASGEKSFDVLDGKDGAGGEGDAGADGGYYVPSVSNDGILSWSPSKSDMPSVSSTDIKGFQGAVSDEYIRKIVKEIVGTCTLTATDDGTGIITLGIVVPSNPEPEEPEEPDTTYTSVLGDAIIGNMILGG